MNTLSCIGCYIPIFIAGVLGQLLLCGILGFRKTFPQFLKVDAFAVLLVLLVVLLSAATC